MAKHMFSFMFRLEQNDQRFPLFNYLSRRNTANSENEFEFIDIKKSPFFKITENTFLLLDNMFLLSKCYYFFIWDFLYDHLLDDVTDDRERKAIIKNFKGIVGLFFEKYLKVILNHSLKNTTYKLKVFEQLKVRINREEKEIADIYIKTKNKIIIGQAKTTSIINREKYAEDLDEFYNGNADNFFIRHGLFQLVKSIEDILKYGKLIDNSIPRKRIKIFPIIVFNDLLLNNFLFPQIFNEKFKSLTENINDKCIKIYPLTLIHVSDLEVLEQSLSERKLDIFKLLKKHSLKSNIQTPFYLTANQERNRNYPARVLKYFKDIIKENNPNLN